MTDLTEGSLTFSFYNGCQVTPYDRWSFVRNQFQSVCGSAKALDILCIDNSFLWLIEVRDYRRPGSRKPSDLPGEIASKVRDTLAGLVAAQCNSNDMNEKQFAKNALQCGCLKVVLHLEQPERSSRLFPRAADPSDVQRKLKGLLKAIDPHPKVVNKNAIDGRMPWAVTG